MPGARAHAPEPPPACRPAPDRLRMPRHPPWNPLVRSLASLLSPSHSPALFPLMAEAAMATPLRNTAASHSLAPSLCSRDPYRLQRHPRQTKHHRKPCNAGAIIFFFLGHRRPSSSIRRRRRFPELVDHLDVTTVSS